MKMENLGIKKLTEELRRLNPEIDICFESEVYPGIIIARCADCANLTFPEGYYISGKNGLTNKHNTTSGMYESFELMTQYDYLKAMC